MSQNEPINRISIGSSIRVDDLSRDDLRRSIVETFSKLHKLERAYILTAIHIGSLLQENNSDYCLALGESDTIYADGISIEKIARHYGASRIERFPLTDLGWEILEIGKITLDRKVRISLIGGPEGLAEEAAVALEAQGSAEVVFTQNGFSIDWNYVRSAVSVSKPDLIFVGLGVPLETILIYRELTGLKNVVVANCGGWFGFLTEREKRAPFLVRRLGFEWLFRLIQDPVRLFRRYLCGFVLLVKLRVQSHFDKSWQKSI